MMNKQRTFGWVQNPSSFKNLKNTVQIFIHDSPNHQFLCRILKENSVLQDHELAAHLHNALSRLPLVLSYAELVGTGRSERRTAPCDALVQASIPDQKGIKGYVDNWTADGFVRWAECLGFIHYDASNDHFSITDLGLAFGQSADELPDAKNAALIQGLLQYPPTYRILSILNQDSEKIYSKFEIGAQLGFTGELGFTSIPFGLIQRQLRTETDLNEIKAIRSDREGSSDKYARMICGWLFKIGLVDKEKINIENQPLNTTIALGHCFRINAKGLRAISMIEGKSKHKRITQYVSWYMLATNAKNRYYLRTRRAKLLQYLMSCKKTDIGKIQQHMQSLGFEHATDTFLKDIQGLDHCGIEIEKLDDVQHGFQLKSILQDFIIPNEQVAVLLNDEELERRKEQILIQVPDINPDFIELIEISRDKTQSMMFEIKVMDLFAQEYGLDATHLGGASKPDGVCSYQEEQQSYGIILDTKAYKEGFILGASEKDKMVRYLTENKQRNHLINPNLWWNNFPKNIQTFYYLFVSSGFIHQYQNGLEQIKNRTQVDGAALDVEQLLLGAQKIKSGELHVLDLPKYFNNNLVIWN